MHLAEIVRLRLLPTAGLFLALTRRCPLSCAHCSTLSSMASEQYPDDPFRRIVDSFTPQSRPQILYLSGGEPLLRAGLVADLARAASAVGTRSGLASGMYFARDGAAITPALRRAIGTVDHFTASLDEFHEREVSRADVFRALHQIRELVPAISLQLTGLHPDEPYLTRLIADVRREFRDEVPMLVGVVGPAGRAREWLPKAGSGDERPAVRTGPDPQPCLLTSWPLVHYDGTVLACCNQEIAARTRPDHLVLGDAAVDPWSLIEQRSLRRHLIRGVRMFGPLELRRRFGAPGPAMAAGQLDGVDPGPYCGACVGLSDDTDLAADIARFLESPAGALMESSTMRMMRQAPASAFSGSYGSVPHRELINLGWREPSCAG